MKFIDKIKDFKNTLKSYPFRKYFKRRECIFIHIPKAAGTSILHTLADGKKIYRDHAAWFEYYKVSPFKFRNYYKFTIVRNPYSRIVSAYTYLKNGGNQKDDLYFKHLFEKENITFDRFILEYLDEYKIHEHVLFKPQYLFLFDHRHELKVDFVGRYENIEHDMEKILQRLNIHKTLERKNITKREKSISEYYQNKEVLDRVYTLYKKDFELLDYQKEYTE